MVLETIVSCPVIQICSYVHTVDGLNLTPLEIPGNDLIPLNFQSGAGFRAARQYV